MKGTGQIAAECRDEVRQYFGKPYYPSDYGSDKVLAIIKSAIEKGIQAWRDGGYDSDKPDSASTGKEWTQDELRSHVRKFGIEVSDDEQIPQGVKFVKWDSKPTDKDIEIAKKILAGINKPAATPTDKE